MIVFFYAHLAVWKSFSKIDFFMFVITQKLVLKI
jgi:hypothetical protein